MGVMNNNLDAIREIAARWYYKEVWGWELDKVATPEELEVFLKAHLIVANGDGQITAAERNWVIGEAAAAGASSALVKELETYPANEDIAEVVARTQTTQNSGRAVIYFAIKAAASDGSYAEGEQKSVAQMAQAIGIPQDVVTEIEEICLEEEKLRERRAALCFPEGIPFK